MKWLLYILLLLTVSCNTTNVAPSSKVLTRSTEAVNLTTKAYIKPYEVKFVSSLQFIEKKPLYMATGSKLIVNGYVFGQPDIVFIGKHNSEPATITVNGCMEVEFSDYNNIITEFTSYNCESYSFNSNATDEDFKQVASNFYQLHSNSNATIKRDGKIVFIGKVKHIWNKMLEDASSDKNYEIQIGNAIYFIRL